MNAFGAQHTRARRFALRARDRGRFVPRTPAGERDGSVSADGLPDTRNRATLERVPFRRPRVRRGVARAGTRSRIAAVARVRHRDGHAVRLGQSANGRRHGETAETNAAAVGCTRSSSAPVPHDRDWRFERASKRAIKGCGRGGGSDLLGNTINVKTGRWINRSGGIGAGCDSFFEYSSRRTPPSATEALDIFGDATWRDAVVPRRWVVPRGALGQRRRRTCRRRLCRVRPGVQVMLGDLESANTRSRFFALRRRFGAQPERFLYADGTVHPQSGSTRCAPSSSRAPRFCSPPRRTTRSGTPARASRGTS